MVNENGLHNEKLISQKIAFIAFIYIYCMTKSNIQV